MVPSLSLGAYQAARQHVAYLDRSDDRGRLVVSGQDRATYLHGLLTNDITALKPGTGCYAAYLTPQGRMISDLCCYELGDVMLLTMDRAATATVLGKLDQFIFGEDVTLGDVTDTFAQIAVVGPDAEGVVAALLDDVAVEMFSSLGEHGNRRAHFRGQSAIVTRISDAGENGYDVYVDRQRADEFRVALTAAGVPALDEETANAIRIESGVPQFHRDMDEDTIPLEAGIESRAISFSKGCYVGQEVIIRVLHRGHGRIARKLVGLTLAGADVPNPGAPVRSETADVGHVTSSTASPALGRPIALAYVRREFVEPGTLLNVNGVEAVVTGLPFV
jgi:folate-binding protein YgfZ